MSGALKRHAGGRPHSRVWVLTGLMALTAPGACPGGKPAEDPPANDLVRVDGGSFLMGDVLGEGGQTERPVHTVNLGDFSISKYEVTVARFRAFVEDTGYRTSAEGPMDLDAHREIMKQAMSGEASPEELTAFQTRILELSGAAAWDPEARRWAGYDPHLSWRSPGFAQGPDHPVVAVSWNDAIHYCNWLSRREGLPPAYDPHTGVLLDENGAATSEVSRVGGFRLPTEAEWEFAARERGRPIRFGNGRDLAGSSEITFDAGAGDYPYLERGDNPRATTPVGGHRPNALGLYDMSGNAWEWVSDRYGPYGDEAQTDPYVETGDERILRGGRWGGDAFEARVFHRSPWVRNDRCNNSGFRVARSAPASKDD